jgi:hypothetical protein
MGSKLPELRRCHFAGPQLHVEEEGPFSKHVRS